MPAFAEAEAGTRELGGVALACFSGGSLVGGLLAGLRPAASVIRRFQVGSIALACALVGLQLAVSMPTLYLLAFLAGLPIAPTIGALYTLIDRTARSGTAAEAFAWFGTAVGVGIAGGSVLAGVVIDARGVRWAFGIGAAVAFGAAMLGWARRGTIASGARESGGRPSALAPSAPRT